MKNSLTKANFNHHQQQKQQINQQNELSFTSNAPRQPQKQPESSISFSSESIQIKCPFCLHRMRTELIRKPQLISIMLGLLLFTIIPNAIMIIVIVIVLQLTATLKHRCSICERQLGTDGKYLLIFTDKVYSFSYKETGILVSKKVLMTIGFAILAITIVVMKSRVQRHVQWAELQWSQYIQECPYKDMSHHCSSQWMGKTVKNWRGYVMRVQDRRQSMLRFYDYAIMIYIKMIPQQQNKKMPDLYLTGSTSSIHNIYQVLDQLKHGDEIVFNATFQEGFSLGQLVKNRHLNIVNLERTNKNNQNIQVYLSKEEEMEYQERIQGKALRQEK